MCQGGRRTEYRVSVFNSVLLASFCYTGCASLPQIQYFTLRDEAGCYRYLCMVSLRGTDRLSMWTRTSRFDRNGVILSGYLRRLSATGSTTISHHPGGAYFRSVSRTAVTLRCPKYPLTRWRAPLYPTMQGRKKNYWYRPISLYRHHQRACAYLDINFGDGSPEVTKITSAPPCSNLGGTTLATIMVRSAATVDPGSCNV